MAVVVPSLPALAGELALYYTTDPLLANSPVLVFHGPASSIGATSSRIQVHVFTPAGCCSYSRLAISPASPFWSAVGNLPREEQGDEVCRGLAFGLKKYFVELSDNVKKEWCIQNKAPAPAALFGDDHVAILATRMTKIENVQQAVDELQQAFGEEKLSWIDVDVVLPPGSIKEPPKPSDSAGPDDLNDDEDILRHKYGQYADLIAALGEITFLPTSRMKRAPSKASSLGRSPSFLKQQKQLARRELNEVLGTERSYVERIKELHNLSQTLGADLKSSSQILLQQIFPPGLKEIVAVNTTFLNSLTTVIEATEDAALRDIDSMTETPTAQQAKADFVEDTQGIGAVAKCFCDSFPSFSICYSKYLQAQAASAQTLRDMLRSEDSALGATITDVGEQKLTSLLIEPVQRLPRYSLYIDNIAKQLPTRHPALKILMKARDVISDICAQDDAVSDMAMSEKLHALISQWPSDLQLTGRLVTAVDFTELIPPFHHDTCKTDSGMLLLLTDGLVILEKTGAAVTTARGMLTELENGPKPSTGLDHRPSTPKGLRFLRHVELSAVECFEMQDNRAVQLLTRSEVSVQVQREHWDALGASRILYFEGSYENRCSRFIEELSKTKIEGRFSEVERETSRWEIRASDPRPDLVNIHSAIFDDSDYECSKLRGQCASSRIVLDLDKHSQRPRAGQQGIRDVFVISPLQDGLWRISVDSVDGSFSRENLPTPDVFPSIRRKLALLIAMRLSIQNSHATNHRLTGNEAILRSLDLQAAATEDASKPVPVVSRERPRSKSPVKMLSSLLSSTGPSGHVASFSRKGSDHTPSSLGSIPRMAPPSHIQTSSKPSSREGRPPSRDPGTPQSVSFTASSEHLVSNTRRLEDTLNCYLLALQARKGNIVGKNLKMRYAADELAVNEIYNGLLEDPNNMVLAAQASVDVIFAAFEKFLNVAWRDQMGQVVPVSVFQQVQKKAETMFPADFDEYFRNTLISLPPQNHRAFKSIMKLLADLLDGTGNDGDRGMLTVAFLEILVTDGNPHQYIALIDRFVDDTDTYFGEPLEEGSRYGDTSAFGHKRSRSANTPSITSNTSSLRRKFGLGGLSRDSSRVEQDSKVASVWRALSKSKGDASPGGSISRGSLHRSQSTDVHPGLLPKRPSSQDGPTSKQNAFDDSFMSGSTTNVGLTTIGEHPTFIPTFAPSGPPKKKRRSSLSDLRSIQAAESQVPLSPPSGHRVLPFQRVLDEKTLPTSSQPTTPSSKSGSGRYGSPTRDSSRSRLPASFRKESSPGVPSLKGPDEVVITNSRLNSYIPTPKPRLVRSQASDSSSREGLQERSDAGNVMKRPSPSPEKAYKTYRSTGGTAATPATKRLRMQSPQKLRERLQNEQSTANTIQASFMDELNKIGEELSSTPSRIGSVRISATPGSRARNANNNGSIANNVDLAARVLKMEGQLPNQVDELRSRIESIQSDAASSLTVSESKCKKLDGLYREANAENEALYNRFNDELGKILKAVKGGEGVEEARKQLRESQEEAVKLRRENQRLKREIAGLRAQLKD